ncbi:hypothetical protein L6164_008365 [Bauhinia variegata]|uniref:Uncharacterized protein n=1 Tax=Bauhinia variegata TaxID=167791 RepID=A0ACB9PFM8_BAUVA|nr:hypothetical protein L6164_008365 [Bauhinia variegata]
MISFQFNRIPLPYRDHFSWVVGPTASTPKLPFSLFPFHDPISLPNTATQPSRSHSFFRTPSPSSKTVSLSFLLYIHITTVDRTGQRWIPGMESVSPSFLL